MSTPEILTLIVSSLTMVIVAIIGYMWRRECTRIDKMDDKIDKLSLDVARLNGKLREDTRQIVDEQMHKQVLACRERERELEEISAVRAHPCPEMIRGD